jgi:multicomponent Na+:H+ antiporter subunit F
MFRGPGGPGARSGTLDLAALPVRMKRERPSGAAHRWIAGRGTMEQLHLILALFLVLNLLGGLVRIVRGPTASDRMLAAQLFGTTGVAVLLLLGQSTGSASLRDVALVFAVLAVVNAVVFARFRPGAPGSRLNRS